MFVTNLNHIYTYILSVLISIHLIKISFIHNFILFSFLFYSTILFYFLISNFHCFFHQFIFSGKFQKKFNFFVICIKIFFFHSRTSAFQKKTHHQFINFFRVSFARNQILVFSLIFLFLYLSNFCKISDSMAILNLF